jgi:antitoxin component HigA of HigAB toxin-antitoxin module
MRKQEAAAFDYHRYRQLLAEAVDEKKRLELICVLIEERARERLEAQRASDRAAMTVSVISTVLSLKGLNGADFRPIAGSTGLAARPLLRNN